MLGPPKRLGALKNFPLLLSMDLGVAVIWTQNTATHMHVIIILMAI